MGFRTEICDLRVLSSSRCSFGHTYLVRVRLRVRVRVRLRVRLRLRLRANPNPNLG